VKLGVLSPALICSLVATALAQSPGLSDAEVAAAIAAAKQPKKYSSMYVEATGRYAAPYSVLLQGPIGRTMEIARVAFEEFKPITPLAIGPTVRAHEITFTVYGHGSVPTIKNLVLMPPKAASRDDAIQPLAEPRSPWRDSAPRTYAPGYNYRLERFFRFSAESIPPGDIQIIVVSEGGGQDRYTVKSIDRERIR
jgi:hypothetical protein